MKESLHYDEIEDRLTIAVEEDVEPILEANKRAFNDASTSHKSQVMNHVARIPYVAIQKYKQLTGVDILSDEKALKAFLNDPENRFFRTRPGKI